MSKKLADFTDMDMIDQILVLEQIRESNNSDLIPELITFYDNYEFDQAVEEMIYHTLYSVLNGKVKAILSTLKHGNPRIVLIGIRRAREDAISILLPALKKLLETSQDSEIISEVLRSFGGFQDSSLTEIISPYLEHKDSAVVAWAMHSLVALGGQHAVDALKDLIEKNSKVIEQAGICDLNTTQAISSISKIRDESVIDFLVKFIHHPVALFRKEVVSSLVRIGASTLPSLSLCINKGRKDEKIMAANVIGWIKNKKGADILAAYLDESSEVQTNLRFSIYEALGRIPSLRSITVLVDALKENDEIILMAVINGLNELCNPGVIKGLCDILVQNGEKARLLMKCIIATKSSKIFEALYKDDSFCKRLIETVAATNDRELIEFFTLQLKSIGGDGSLEDIERLARQSITATSKQVVAVDDSKAMLFFYKNAVADLAVEIKTFPDGTDAFEYLSKVESVKHIDLLITDMNMPGMDGLQLTRELRKIERWVNLPILMATTETESSQTKQAAAAGVNYFVSKPFSKETLLEKLKEILGS